MPMKKLSQFLVFDFPAFSRDKILEVTDVRDWMDFDEKKKRLGTIVEVVILEDNTLYNDNPECKPLNRFEKINIKISSFNVAAKVGDIVEPIDAVATVYGEHRNQLSVKAAGIRIVEN